MKSKIHRATVTDSNLNYEGSITIDSKLMQEADIIEYEKVQVVNVNNGNRFETYAITGKERSGTICLNGAAARLAHPGDKVIIITYALMTTEEAKAFKPTILLVDERNFITL
jgi:aspartate 1-decarboxylase